MKLGLALMGLLPVALHAQTISPYLALETALATRSQWIGPEYAEADLRISSAYAEANGLEHIYVQQAHAGIPVYNSMATLAFAQGQLATHSGSFVPAKLLAGLPTVPALSAAGAVSRALLHVAPTAAVVPVMLSEDNGPEARHTFAETGVARRAIVASLTWAMDEAGRPHLAWNVNVELLHSADWWNVRVDAATGLILGQDNWTVEEQASSTTAARLMGARTQATARRQPPPPPPSATSSTFFVVGYPRENPGTLGFQTETDPWLKAGAGNSATTHGWNFDGTTNYVTTRGNNVAAYDDSLKANAPGRYASSSTAAPTLTFSFSPNPGAAPTTPANRNAATVNLFYWNNIVHDLTYQYGFTEAAGNFQADNLGRGGRGNDYVRAEAQDGSGTNNANFSTPADGTSGRMQMFLWSPAPMPYSVQVSAPATVAGSYPAVEGGFSTANRLSALGPIAGQLGLFIDAGSSPATNQACGTHGGSPLTGKIALLYRGTCGFAVKVKNAQLAGAIAAIVVNNVAGAPIVMGGTDNTVTIPAVMISLADGDRLAAQAANGVQAVLPRPAAAGPALDGDLDNGIVVHEYGHGVSTRLTGGPANSSCLSNAEQGGEGWSDYLALMMTTDWANTQLSDGPNARPVGNYAVGQASTGTGIRRYPYSNSLTTNPLTYANVATNPEVHAIGEVWCAALWDMTWAVIQQRGNIQPNLFNGAANGGNNVALQLVMQGMKLQPCQPGFLDSRDAILKADSVLYQGQYQNTIWAAFARRGMGYSASQGSSGSATDQVAAFDIPPPAKLLPTAGVVASNIFDVSLQVSSLLTVPNTPYVLTDELPAGMQFLSSSTGGTLVGNKVTFSNITFTAPGQVRTLRFQAQATAAAACAPVFPVNDNRDVSTTGGFTPQSITGTTGFAPSTARANTGTSSWFSPAPDTPADFVLTSAPFTPTGLSVLSFYHYYNFEGGFDGGAVEISTNNGTTWQNAKSFFVLNAPNTTLDPSTTAPGAWVFSGQSATNGTPGFIRSVVDLRSFAGTSVLVRFHTRTDNGSPAGPEGWFIDDIAVLNGCGGDQRIELRDNSGNLAGSQSVVSFLLPVGVTLGQQSTLAQATEFSAQPNPFGSQGLRLNLGLPTGLPQVSITLLDVTGRVLLRRTTERLAAGPSTVQWPEAAGLPAGLYLVRVQLPDGSSRTLRVSRE
ncbi:M36 family metallopeptidase [Hymenobacter sp. UYCo722]|uniref:M36 family metallopeptidase n=1 Tax=Hymenobacter sp. UYCo722 TaxID=3156335 RepID=UPI0033941386